MSHEPKSPSLGMISTATRTTVTVSPLTPSPLNGSIVANGSPATQSAHSGFAAALRKLAKQAEEPRGKNLRIRSSCFSLLLLLFVVEFSNWSAAFSLITLWFCGILEAEVEILTYSGIVSLCTSCMVQLSRWYSRFQYKGKLGCF